MASNPPGQGMAHVSTSVPVEVLEEIDRRASALELKRGAYLRHILQMWFDQGAPPVTASDEAVRQVAEGKGRYDPKPSD